MEITNEQIEELIAAYEQANDDDLSLTISFLKELKDLRSKPLCVAPSEDDVQYEAFRFSEEETLSFSDHMAPWKRAGYVGFEEGAYYMRNAIKPITPTQWSQIRDALCEALYNDDFDGTQIAQAVELMDSIRKDV